MRNRGRRDLQDLPREQHLPNPAAYPVANHAPTLPALSEYTRALTTGGLGCTAVVVVAVGGGGGGGGGGGWFQMDCGACVFVGPYRYCEARDPPVLALTFDDGPTDTTTVRPRASLSLCDRSRALCVCADRKFFSNDLYPPPLVACKHTVHYWPIITDYMIPPMSQRHRQTCVIPTHPI